MGITGICSEASSTFRNKRKKGGSCVPQAALATLASGIHRQSTLVNSTTSSKKGSSYSMKTRSSIGTKAETGRQLIDEDGNDMTPLPLLTRDPSLPESVGAPESAETPQASLYKATAASIIAGPFARSTFLSVDKGGGRFAPSPALGSMFQSMESISMLDEHVESGIIIIHDRHEEPEELTEEDLQKAVDINLSETETFFHLNLPGTVVSVETEEAVLIQEQNRVYEELCKSRAGNNSYIERGMNTFNNSLKKKLVQTRSVTKADGSCNTTTWDLHDTYALIAEEEADKEKQDAGENDYFDHFNMSALDAIQEEDVAEELAALRTPQSIGSVAQLDGSKTSITPESSFLGSTTSAERNLWEKQILEAQNFKEHLFVMERIINGNILQAKQAIYRGQPILKDIDFPKVQAEQNLSFQLATACLDKLLDYFCAETKGHPVSCMRWNPVNHDLLAVSYGEVGFVSQQKGLVCCWSVKNPQHPEKIYHSAVAATAVAFSKVHPNLLAVGRHDGTLAIYDVSFDLVEPILDSHETGGKHTAPVWQLEWIEKEKASGEIIEVLISVSNDGQVLSWSLQKGLECSVLMKLTRVSMAARKKAKDKKSEAFVSRIAGGYCFDFQPNDLNTYLVGTDEGFIHKCSCSYNEQYMETYRQHEGAVYCVKFSPYVPKVFLSCGADWTVRLWMMGRQTPILVFKTLAEAIYGVNWSPWSSTVFACVSAGALEVWDLSSSTLNPIIEYASIITDVGLTTLSFPTNSKCMLVGDDNGHITIYVVKNVFKPKTDSEEIAKLNNIIQSVLFSEKTLSQRK